MLRRYDRDKHVNHVHEHANIIIQDIDDKMHLENKREHFKFIKNELQHIYLPKKH